ncbi:DUF1493 family protein [Hymenobacter cellulosivorans]|uniref:DUF1493 family protein n=1 Tax=Hymenobacter cellulosivorans TaxID=2932249 RepID=A0ABY4F4P2_9BACT|nr:DUF1493 family protein [Hymenobacter cellulosivorans]UOQ51525.1 DUF1493 family protein [Hymenobacter cellulosivorans]
METIEVRFTDLRRMAMQVLAFVETQLACEAQERLRTSIEDDMGSYGDDTVELLENFAKQFNVDVTKFDFTGFISPEGFEDGNPLHLIVFLLFISVYAVAWATKLMMGLTYLPFNPKAAISLIKVPIGNPFAPTHALHPKSRHDTLTIGDFVASAAAGRFVKRERVRFVLV